MARQKRTVGSILEIDIDGEYYAYAQILTEADCAFFDFKSDTKLKDIKILETVSILFIIAVYTNVITSGRWVKIGKLPIRPELLVKPMKFIQDFQKPTVFEFYDPNTGKISPANKNEIIGLERASVWADVHAEGRIRDHYNGIPNVWVERFKLL